MFLFCRYDDDLGGVPIAYSNLCVLSRTGIVHPYFPLTRVVVTAEFTIFKPRDGAHVVGSVSKVSEDYIGLVVLGFMNAVIKRDSIRQDLYPDMHHHSWISKSDASHKITVGDSVRFVVSSLQFDGAFVSLIGSLMTRDTGNLLNPKVIEASSKSSSKSDKTKIKGNHIDENQKDRSEKAKKKSKEAKRKHRDGSESEHLETITDPHTKKRKKNEKSQKEEKESKAKKKKKEKK